MSEITSPADSGLAPLASRGRSGYAEVRSVERRAQVTNWGQDSQARASVDRLSNLLQSGTPLRQDVPAGHYLDIRV